MRKTLLRSILVVGLLSLSGALFAGPAGPVMYGGNGGHGDGTSVHDGWLVIVDQTTAAVTTVGHPDSVKRITGLAFDSAGNLYGSTIGGAPFPPPPPVDTSKLIRINPDTGAQISSVNITDGGNPISINDLAIQPCTDVLYGVRSTHDTGGATGQAGKLYTIDKTTGVATLVINTGHFFGSIAFGPDGTLYMSAADLVDGNVVNPVLETRNPATGALQSSIPAAEFYGSLAVRPTDGAIFAGNGDFGQIFTVDPATGAETLVGSTGQNFVGDLAFRPTSSPAPGLDLNCLSPAELWIGLKNSDDVGTKFDLRAQVLFNGSVIGSGELDSVPGGSSGFNNARERAVSMTLTANPTVETGDIICFVPQVRIATQVAGHRSGTARLWYNDAAADSRFDIRLGTLDHDLFLIDFSGFGGLSLAPGTGPKKTSDVFVDKAVNGNPWKTFGSFCATIVITGGDSDSAGSSFELIPRGR